MTGIICHSERKRRIYVFLVVLTSTFVYFLFPTPYLFAQHQHGTPPPTPVKGSETKKVKFWTCSMHSQIKLPKPGKCPICGMDLIPIYEEAEEEKGVSRLTLSDTARKLAEIETSAVAYRNLTVEMKLLGKVEYDETKIAQITSWIPGRIERLYVNFVGAKSEKGQPLLQIYSPELRTAQEEYLIAFRRWQEAVASNDPNEITSSLKIKEAVQKKLELWGILPEQIKKVEDKRDVQDKMDIYAPISGVIVEREAFEGKYFQTGDMLFKIADLSTLWIKLDVYEKDLTYVHVGQKIDFITESFSGGPFSGKVVFIDPFLNEMTRTTKVRLEIANPDERLKPGMFGHAILRLGLGKKLSIPATAPLLTGKRAVVYVEVKPNVFEGKEVVLGTRAGDFYPVISGLRAGERVVTKGNFKIDASLQIQAKPSMMKPEEEK
ncbi:MAG: efflux RND transporter periplasmic adaptor subunit [Candidatus Omnitrophota bacterium]